MGMHGWMRLGGLTLLAFLVLQTVAFGAESRLYQQKLSLVNRFLESSDTAKRRHPEAESLLSAARTKRDVAKKAYEAGEEKQAIDLLSQAIRLTSEASRKSADQASQAWLHRARYEDLSDSMDYFQETYRKYLAHAEEKQRQAAQKSLEAAAPLTSEAAQLAGKKAFEAANQRLSRAQEILVAGLKPLLGSRSLVYALKFETPRQEYEYEVRRSESLEALIRMALAESASSGDAEVQKAVSALLNKSREQQKEAQKIASAGQFESAIRTQEGASQFLVQALRQLGVMIPL